MKTTTAKSKNLTETQLLELLKKILPKTIHDPKLVAQIYDAIEQALKAKVRANAFEKFCDKVELPNLEPATIQEVKEQFVAAFGDGDVTIKPNKKEQSLAVEIDLPDGVRFTQDITVREVDPDAEEEEFAAKFVPFPVCLPGDKELVWLLAKRETLTPEEAAIALDKLQEDFWASKTGQKLLRDRVERSFPEFISRAPSSALSEVGLKRHYKMPEPVKLLRPAPKTKEKS
jgi:hypothetical protein